MIWKCKNKEIEYGKDVLIMGIVNVTPDSFSDGGDHFSPDDAVDCAFKLIDDGADIIDKEEWERLEPVLKALNGKISVPVSIDTYYPYVAEKSLSLGADIINDVSGVINPDMAKIIKESGAGWVIMHNGAGSAEDIKKFFEASLAECKRLNIDKSQICLDMGIGFGKNYKENLELLTKMDYYKIKAFPLLLGTSRKRVIGEGSRQSEPKQRIYGNIAADTVAIMQGVDIIRLHDVLHEKQGIYMAQALRDAYVK